MGLLKHDKTQTKKCFGVYYYIYMYMCNVGYDRKIFNFYSLKLNNVLCLYMVTSSTLLSVTSNI